MSVRVVLLLITILGLGGLVAQNLSPQLPLVFLGWRSLPLPLGYWLLIAVGLGVLTGILILGLLRLSRYLTWRQMLSSGDRSTASGQSKTGGNPRSASTAQSFYTDPADEFDDQPVDRANHLREEWSYEKAQPERKGRQSGSTYSYSYKDAQASGAGRPESVYDADYRVITPPHRPADDFEDDEG
jgi:uncharacterized integral membrane protein